MRFPVKVFNYGLSNAYGKPLEYKFKLADLASDNVVLNKITGWSEFKPVIVEAQPSYGYIPFDERGRFIRFQIEIEGQTFYLMFCASDNGGWVLFTPLHLKAVFKKVCKSTKEIMKDLEKEREVFQKLGITVANIIKHMFKQYSAKYVSFVTAKNVAANNFVEILKNIGDEGYLTIERKINPKTKAFYLCKEDETIGVLNRLYLNFERKHATSNVSSEPIVAS